MRMISESTQEFHGLLDVRVCQEQCPKILQVHQNVATRERLGKVKRMRMKKRTGDLEFEIYLRGLVGRPKASSR